MKAVMISIQPKWCELIANGKKTIEVRKTKPKLETPFKCYIYETKGKTDTPTFIDEEGHEIYEGRGQVIGEFVCDKITDMRDMGGEEFFSTSCMTYEDWRNYTDYTKHIIWGWHISSLKIYDKPKELSGFIKPCVNDLWCEVCAMYREFEDKCYNGALRIKRPPQSWCYVEELNK